MNNFRLLKPKCRNCATDETLIFLARLNGKTFQKGTTFYLRQGDSLIERVYLGKREYYEQDLGDKNSPWNLRLYYKNLKDATILERHIMMHGGAITPEERMSCMFPMEEGLEIFK
jgi:hypothetical protein